MSHLKYLAHYPQSLLATVEPLIANNQLAAMLAQKYPKRHELQTDPLLYDYVSGLKAKYFRNAPALARVCYDPKIRVLQQALGVHRQVSRVQGSKLKSKNEIRIASLFKSTPPEFLKMIVVHELAHLKEKDHNRAFYQLCQHMEPDYHQYEFDLRLYLTAQEWAG